MKFNQGNTLKRHVYSAKPSSGWIKWGKKYGGGHMWDEFFVVVFYALSSTAISYQQWCIFLYLYLYLFNTHTHTQTLFCHCFCCCLFVYVLQYFHIYNNSINIRASEVSSACQMKSKNKYWVKHISQWKKSLPFYLN